MKTYHYLNCLPGAGKTHFAIGQILSDRESVHFYVTPTIILGEQTRQDLIDKGLSPAKVILISAKNSSFGTSEAVLNTLRPRIRPGLVVVMSHQAFVQLPPFPESEKIRVYFDEARKFVLKDGNLKLTSARMKNDLIKVLKPYSEELLTKDYIAGTYTKFGFKRISIPPNSVSIAKLSKEITNRKHEDRLQYTEIFQFLKDAANPKFDIYVPSGIFKPTDESLDKVISIHKVVVPSRAFTGFKSVLLMSAYFEDSQMFHLLTKASHQSQETENPFRLTDLAKADDGLNKTLYDRQSTIMSRFKQAILIPLTENEKKISDFRYRTEVIAPASEKENLRQLVCDCGITSEALREYRRTGEIGEGHEPFFNYLTSVNAEFSLIDWLLRSSRRVVRHLKKKKKLVEQIPLLVVNKRFEANEAKPYLESEEFISIPGQSHGLNTYKASNTIVYLSAINPSPEISRLFNALIPDYDPDLDHAADSAIQAVTRLSLRDTTSKSKVFVIVPDLALTTMIFFKMKRKPRVDRKYAKSLDVFSVTSLIKEESQSVNKIHGSKGTDFGRLGAQYGHLGGAPKLNRSEKRIALDKKLASLRASRSRLRKGGQTSKAEELTERINSLAAKVNALSALENPS